MSATIWQMQSSYSMMDNVCLALKDVKKLVNSTIYELKSRIKEGVQEHGIPSLEPLKIIPGFPFDLRSQFYGVKGHLWYFQ
jgi:hypothetical protein